MLNYIWSVIMLLCIVFFGLNPNGSNFATVLFSSIEKALSLTLSLGGIMCFWSGIMRIAEDAGLCESFSRLLHPLLRPFFPNLKKKRSSIEFYYNEYCRKFSGYGKCRHAARYIRYGRAGARSLAYRYRLRRDVYACYFELCIAPVCSVNGYRTACGSGSKHPDRYYPVRMAYIDMFACCKRSIVLCFKEVFQI